MFAVGRLYCSAAPLLPVPRRARVVIFNALRAKKVGFLTPVTGASDRNKPWSRLGSSAPGKTPIDAPEFEVVVPKTQSSPLREAAISEFVPLPQLNDENVPQTFGELGVVEGLEAALMANGIRQPTPVQIASVGAILDEKDAAIQCYTGSGKTLAYLIPILMMALTRAEEEMESGTPDGEFGQLQALIVAPSRELAMQIVRVAKSLLPEEAHPAIHQCIGGANYARQVEGLKQKPIIVVGTPGRLSDHSRAGRLTTHKCPILVLDEVDQLLAQHFTEDMLRITEHVGKKLPHRQTVLVSATLTPNAVKKVGQWAPGSEFLFIGSQESMTLSPRVEETSTSPPQWGWGSKPSTSASAGGAYAESAALSLPPTLKHGYVVVPVARKVDMLRRLIYGMDAKRAMVFMNFQKRLKDTLHKLAAKKMEVGSMHGESTKLEREQTLKNFREGKYRALIVSDVVARGVDVEECDAVFNLELPNDGAHYAHRAGRTGRMGREGWVVSLVSPNEVFVISKLAKKIGIDIHEVEVGGGEVKVKGAFRKF
ncbi:hypothetical protein BSKO_02257 [Bryopsis sp. KO-2023]|nr:hypothetical protein BSKO_02257 [Bryopsis sp. KO-2023]